MSITSSQIKALALESGFDVCGIASLKTLTEAESRLQEWIKQGKHAGMCYLEEYPERKKKFFANFPDAKSVIVVGVNYWSEKGRVPFSSSSWTSGVPSPLMGEGEDGGVKTLPPTLILPLKGGGDFDFSIARYARGRDYHKVISEKLEILKEKVIGIAGPSARCETAVDTKPLLERSLAVEAGIGFIGRQSQLISPEFGPWLFLAEIITNLDLESDRPVKENCGKCKRCVEACPMAAIGKDKTIDARKCIAYLTIEHKGSIPEDLRLKMGNWIFGCDRCLEVCPYASKQKETHWKEFSLEEKGTGSGSTGSEPVPFSLDQLISIKSSREYDEKFSDSAISRASRKQLMRNVCVALGNAADREVLPLLEKLLSDPSDLVKEHAAWAIRNISGS